MNESKELYEKVLEVLKEFQKDSIAYAASFCWALATVLYSEEHNSSILDSLDPVSSEDFDRIYLSDYPKLLAYRPEDAQMYWFDPKDFDTRIKIIEEIISSYKKESCAEKS